MVYKPQSFHNKLLEQLSKQYSEMESSKHQFLSKGEMWYHQIKYIQKYKLILSSNLFISLPTFCNKVRLQHPSAHHALHISQIQFAHLINKLNYLHKHQEALVSCKQTSRLLLAWSDQAEYELTQSNIPSTPPLPRHQIGILVTDVLQDRANVENQFRCYTWSVKLARLL